MMKHKFEYGLQSIIYSDGWGILGQEIFAVNDGRCMLEALFDLFMREGNERNKNQAVRDYLEFKNSPDHLKLIFHTDVYGAFATLHALSLSYISLACTTEGLAKGIYNKLISFSRQYFPKPLSMDAPKIQNRETEMSKLMLIRNKVTAHVAAVDPRHDSSITQETSCLRFQYGLAANTKDLSNYKVGGPYASMPGQANTLANIDFSLKNEHQSIMNHFDHWEKMIMDAQSVLATQCPFTYQQKIQFTTN